jgi:hypothetical protein
MIEQIDFETYLYVSNNKFQIFVYDKINQNNLYKEELRLNDKFNFEDFNNLSKFLDNNIYKIEKLVGNFIKNIILIIENDKNLYVDIAVKKKNYDKSINQKYLENSLTELKDLFQENYQEQTIMHMVMVNNAVNEKENYLSSSNSNSDLLFLEVNFISISNNLVIIFDKILEKYQTKISQYLCGNYIKNFFKQDDIELSKMVHKIINGQNNNEVLLIPKNVENKGFFEKFFQLFS